MSLDEYLESACEANRESIEARDYNDPWQSPLFEFTWLAKGHPEMKNLSAGQALHRVEAWLMNGRSGSRAAAWLDEFSTVGVDSAEDARAEFVDLWAKIKFPPGCSPLETALERAKECRLVPADCPTDGYADFISLAGHLQALRGPNMILLPCHKLGRLLGLSHMTIARSREWAVKDGHLRITRAHKFGSHEATEFRFDVSRYAAISRATSGLPNRTPRRLAAFWPAITRSRMMVLSSSATAPSTMKTILPAGVDLSIASVTETKSIPSAENSSRAFSR